MPFCPLNIFEYYLYRHTSVIWVFIVLCRLTLAMCDTALSDILLTLFCNCCGDSLSVYKVSVKQLVLTLTVFSHSLTTAHNYKLRHSTNDIVSLTTKICVMTRRVHASSLTINRYISNFLFLL